MSQLHPPQVLGANEPVHFQLITKEKKQSERKQLVPIVLPEQEAETPGTSLKMNVNLLVNIVLTNGE